MNAEGERLRVVQWATGNIGLRSLRAVIEHPDLELVGLYVYSEAKEGRDAGELCGAEPTGVRATRQVDDIVALEPDCVLYMGDRTDVDVLCRLLESGTNVVATRSDLHHPASMDPTTPRPPGGCMPGRGIVPAQHRLEPGLHHRGPADRARIVGTPARPPHH